MKGENMEIKTTEMDIEQVEACRAYEDKVLTVDELAVEVNKTFAWPEGSEERKKEFEENENRIMRSDYKILQWLEQQTGKQWSYVPNGGLAVECKTDKFETSEDGQVYKPVMDKIVVYNFKDKKAHVTMGGNFLNVSGAIVGIKVKMEPREFVEFIAAGRLA